MMTNYKNNILMVRSCKNKFIKGIIYKYSKEYSSSLYSYLFILGRQTMFYVTFKCIAFLLYVKYLIIYIHLNSTYTHKTFKLYIWYFYTFVSNKSICIVENLFDAL